MNKVNVTAFICVGIVAAWPMVALSQSGAAPQIAFDIPKIDVDTLLKNAPPPSISSFASSTWASTTSASASSTGNVLLHSLRRP